MIHDKFDALLSLKPNGEYSWVGTEYANLTGSDKPTESEIDAEVTRLNNAEPMRLLRVERDRLLTACDWRASSDLTLADTWKTYRQELRDVPSQAGFPDNITWPTKPS